MGLFFLTAIIFNMAASFTHPVTPTIFTNLNLGSYMFGYALAAMMCANFAVSPFWGMINSYISSRTSLLICGIGYGLGQAMFAMATLEWQFIVARIFAGVFTGGAFVSIMTYIVNQCEDPKLRGTYLTINATIQAVAGAFGYFVGGLLGGIDTYLPVWLQAFTLATCGVIFFVLCKKDAKIPISDMKIKKLFKEANPFTAFAASREFMTVTLIGLFLMCVFQNLSYTAFDQTFNYYICDQLAFPSTYNGFIKGSMGLITLVANSTICIWIIKHTDIKKSIIFVFVLCTISLTTAMMMEQIVPFIIINIILFAFNGISMPILQALVSQRGNEKNRNLIMGFYNAMKSLGGIIGSFLAGYLYDVNAKFPFYFAIFGFAMAAACGLMYLNRSKAETAN